MRVSGIRSGQENGRKNCTFVILQICLLLPTEPSVSEKRLQWPAGSVSSSSRGAAYQYGDVADGGLLLPDESACWHANRYKIETFYFNYSKHSMHKKTYSCCRILPSLFIQSLILLRSTSNFFAADLIEIFFAHSTTSIFFCASFGR